MKIWRGFATFETSYGIQENNINVVGCGWGRGGGNKIKARKILKQINIINKFI